MTLLITVATKDALYLSSDYRLSDKGKPTETTNGAKQLSVQGKRWLGQISFTGVAKDGNGYDTRAWIQDVAASTPPDAPLEHFIEALVQRGTQAIATIQHYDNRLTVVVAAVSDRKCRLFVVSNWEALFAPAPHGRSQLRSCEVTITRPRVLVHGRGGTVPRSLRRRIQHLAALHSGRDQISSTLAMANEFAARRSGGTISPGCWVQALLSDGNSFGRNHGEVPGTPSNIFASGFDMGKWIAAEFPAAPGKKLTLVQSVGYMGRGSPAPTEIGESRTILFSSPANVVSITLGAGGPVIATLSIAGTKGELTVRKNQYASASLGTVSFSGNPVTLSSAKPFFVKRLRLSCVPTVDGAQPRTWDYVFDIKFAGTTLEVTISQNSMAFRSANAPAPPPVLGSNEELVMAAPVGGLTLSITPTMTQTAATLEVQFLLRDFPELRRNAEVP
jgi:hypothetical protein